MFKSKITSLLISAGDGIGLDFLLLLLDHVELITDGRAVLALMRVEDLLDLYHTLASILVLVALLVDLLARVHDLSGSA